MQPRQVPTKDVKPRVSAGEGKFDQAPATGLSSAAEQGKAAIEQQIKNVVPLQEGEHPKPQDVHKVCMEGHAPSQATHPVEARPQQSAEKATQAPKQAGVSTQAPKQAGVSTQAPKQAGVSTQAPKLAGASTQESAKKTCVLCTPGSKDPCLHGDLSDYQAQFNKNEFFGAELPSENCDFYYNYALKQLEVACGCHGVGPDCATYVGQAERAYTRVTLMERNVLYPEISRVCSDQKLDKAICVARDAFLLDHDYFDAKFKFLGKCIHDHKIAHSPFFHHELVALKDALRHHHNREALVWEVINPLIPSDQRKKLNDQLKDSIKNVPDEPFKGEGSFFQKLFGSKDKKPTSPSSQDKQSPAPEQCERPQNK